MTRLALAALPLALACGGGQTPPATPDPEPVAPSAAPDAGASSEELEQIAAIEHAVTSNVDAVYGCWKLAAAEDYRLGGRVVLGIEFVAGGTKVAAVTDEPNNVALTTCLIDLYEHHAWPVAFEPGTVLQLPFDFVAPQAQYTVHRAHVGIDRLAEGVTEQSILDRRSTGNERVRLAWIEVAPAAAVKLGAIDGTHAAYLLRGSLSVRRRALAAAPAALYATPGTPTEATAGADGATLVLVAVPGGAGTGKSKLTARPGGKVAAVDIAGGAGNVQILVDEAVVGHRAAYVGVLTAKPGMKVPLHVHERETELLFVLTGEGVMRVANNDYPVEPDMAIQIPPGTEHSFEVTSDEPVTVLQFYSPSGPEQRFKRP